MINFINRFVENKYIHAIDYSGIFQTYRILIRIDCVMYNCTQRGGDLIIRNALD